MISYSASRTGIAMGMNMASNDTVE